MLVRLERGERMKGEGGREQSSSQPLPQPSLPAPCLPEHAGGETRCALVCVNCAALKC
jgi:hypothetical protein